MHEDNKILSQLSLLLLWESDEKKSSGSKYNSIIRLEQVLVNYYQTLCV